MPATWKNGLESEETLPDPRLNPMINPRLGKNLGRWANVYYTTPAERRDQAVLELVRELEGSPGEGGEDGSGREEEVKPTEIAKASAVQAAVSEIDTTHHRFCLLCGAAVHNNHCARESEQALLAGQPTISTKGETDTWPASEDLKNAASAHEKLRRKHIIWVLLACTLLTAWSVNRIGLESTVQIPSVPVQAASLPVPLVEATVTPPAPASVAPRKVETSKPAQPVRHPLAAARKPPAGRPIECANDHLKNCTVTDLYKKTMALANGIDTLFVAYDHRMTQVVREARKRPLDSASQRQNRLRRANLSAQAWERVQLASYTGHEKLDALRFRAELMRRVNRSRLGKDRLDAYEHPQSCLDLHYIAGDLRRMAGELPVPRYGNRASVR